ncbi:MAG: DNA repair protein RecO [Holosporales bacterium]|jgi:DNA repair protein RecO (recombination protein O)|nr:DNA repair protein RecO [Holosporales bacterium]
MNKWSDCGIVISSSKYGEKYKIVNIFTENHGKFSGLTSRNKDSVFSIFSKVEINWNTRNNNLIGFWHLKNEKQNWIYSFNSNCKISIIQSLTCLLNNALPIGIKYQELFEIIDLIYNDMNKFTEKQLIYIYAYFEFILLEKVGFGFDLKVCCICNRKEELHYISPKTGQVASKNCVQDHRKLFEIPKIWTTWKSIDINEIMSNCNFLDASDIKKSLDITLYFINKNIFNFDNFFRINLNNYLYKAA